MPRRAIGTSDQVIQGLNVSALQPSGDTSSTLFANWFVHSQTINGMWVRKFVYESSPSLGAAGVPSACPAISFNYLDVNVTVRVEEQIVEASYASGYTIPHEVDYISDSTTGGFGLSGTFRTTQVGLIRKLKVITDKEYNCQQRFNTEADKLPGPYDGTFDTSASFNGIFLSDILMPASQSCTNFKTSLVNI